MLIELEVDWEDKYRRLKAKYEEYKVENRQYEETIKKLKVANRRLENTGSHGRRNLGLTLKMNDQDEQQYDNVFREQLCKLKLTNRELSETISGLQKQIKSKSREIAYLKSVVANPRRNQRAKSASTVDSMMETERPPAVHVQTVVSDNIQEVSRSFKMRLGSLKDELDEFKGENDQLRAQLRTLKAQAPETLHEPMQVEGSQKAREWASRCQQLQTEFEYLQTKSEVQSQTLRQAEKKIDSLNRMIRDMRRVMEDLQHEKAAADAKATRMVELEEQLCQVQQCNRNLELRLASLCETPFIKEAFMKQDTLARWEAAAQEVDDHKARVIHLQDAVKTHFTALEAMKVQMKLAEDAKDAAQRQVHELTTSHAHVLGEKQVTVQENERLQNLLIFQSGISKQLHGELESTRTEKDAALKDLTELRGLNLDMEAAVADRLAQIHTLERAMEHMRRQLDHGDHTNRRSMEDTSDTSQLSAQQRKQQQQVLSELLQGRCVEELRRSENMLEVRIKSAMIEQDVIDTRGASSFVVVDFCDFESQATVSLPGSNPHWNFSATYKLKVDDFLLRFLAVDSIVLDLNLASRGEVKLLGRCAIPLSNLLQEGSQVIQVRGYPVQSVSSDEIVARLDVDVCLALPVSELYQSYLKRTLD